MYSERHKHAIPNLTLISQLHLHLHHHVPSVLPFPQLPLSHPSQRLPPPIVNIALQLPRNETLNAALKPHLPQQGIVPLLVEEELMVASERGIDFAVLVEVWCDGPGTMGAVEEENHAFTDVYEDANLPATSGVC